MATKYKLTITFPDGAVSPFDLSKPSITIGSGIQNTVILPHDSVAANHAELSLDVSGYLITDLVGEGKTLLNGYALEQGASYQLEGGTQLTFGEISALFEVEVEAQAQAAPKVQRQADFPAPGSFPAPKHAPGSFVPLKKQMNLAMILSVVLSVVAVLGAVALVLMSSEIRLPSMG